MDNSACGQGEWLRAPVPQAPGPTEPSWWLKASVISTYIEHMVPQNIDQEALLYSNEALTISF